MTQPTYESRFGPAHRTFTPAAADVAARVAVRMAASKALNRLHALEGVRELIDVLVGTERYDEETAEAAARNALARLRPHVSVPVSAEADEWFAELSDHEAFYVLKSSMSEELWLDAIQRAFEHDVSNREPMETDGWGYPL